MLAAQSYENRDGGASEDMDFGIRSLLERWRDLRLGGWRMSAPNLSRALVLQSPVATPDGAGGFTTTWHSLGTHWGRDRRAHGGRNAFGALGPSGQVALRITLRGRALWPATAARAPTNAFVEGQRNLPHSDRGRGPTRKAAT